MWSNQRILGFVISILLLCQMVIFWTCQAKANLLPTATLPSSSSLLEYGEMVRQDALTGCRMLTDEDLKDNLPLQFYCQRRSRLHPSFSSEAAVRAWQHVRHRCNISEDAVMSILRKSRSYTPEKLSITLWSTGKDEGAEFVLREGVGDLYHLKEQGSRAAAGLALDLGSNLGAVTIQLSRLHPQWTIVAVEAMPITFLYQVVNLWLNVRHEMQRGVIVPTLHALSSVDGATVTMQFREDSTTSSRDWNPDSEDWRTTLNVSIQTISLPSLLHDVFPAILKFPPIDLLKIDCEGCEYDVIPALSEEHISSISHAVAETHYDGMLKNGRAGPPVSQVERTHQRLCQQWSVCIDAVSGKNYDPPYRPSATLLQKL